MTNDEEHLKLLSVFHYVVGGLMALFACMPLIHMFIGLFFIISPESMTSGSGEAPPAFIGWLFFSLGTLFFLIGQTIAICVILSGRFLAGRKKYMFSFIVGCVQCAFIPFGTVLGIFTIIVLSRDSVKALYGGL
ncbi:MAG: hypothetical protein HN737_05800 [Desulfobacterales bacterium]|jgi:hypothetical protein|nr:hypothetical protein [Desulfobacteraceae bacterium]MBT4364550.1 hypothetical protein [Desulfobacteraceae bacterium]MBT7085938.1 hypothetical protein [Desulfobacterales bacterium]MBT7696904.1 hypothetical protein [Desulfobacterales bacterium]